MPKYGCPICASDAELLDVVDFNKSCEELNGKFLPKSGIPVYYAICSSCSFVFAPEFLNWTTDEFSSKIYNAEYIEVDPDYVESRPVSNFNLLNKLFGKFSGELTHLDYGGGNGKLSQMLKYSNWKSTSFDPFSNTDVKASELGNFNFITAFEVFEHAPNPRHLMCEINSMLADDGLIFFSTLKNDGNIKINERLSWWYASPRNGHVSLYSNESLNKLGQMFNLNFGSLGVGVHVYFRKFPSWASALLG